MSALVISGDTSGAITLQSPAVAGTNTVNFGANTGTAILDANTPAFRNRIINGRMSISQRGTSFSTRSGYTLDRWLISIPTPTTVSTTQSTDAPTGFTNSLLVTVTTGGTIGASANYITQFIEGNNVADFSFGTSNASSVTISFWVKSSVTGTFGASLRNYTDAPATTFRGYPFTYTVTSANTWEQKTVTIAGDGTGGAGQWNTGTQGSFSVFFDLGSGVLTGTANAWASSNLIGVTGTQTSLMTGSGNTFYLTGVQLEKGSTATSFDYRPYGTELQLCQRYAWTIKGSSSQQICNGFVRLNAAFTGTIQFPVTMRTNAALTVPNSAGYFNVSWGSSDTAMATISVAGGGTLITENNALLQATLSAATVGQGGVLSLNNASSYVLFTAEL